MPYGIDLPVHGDIVMYGFKQDIKYYGALGMVIGTEYDGRVLVMWHTRKGNTLFELHQPVSLEPVMAARCEQPPDIELRPGFFNRKR